MFVKIDNIMDNLLKGKYTIFKHTGKTYIKFNQYDLIIRIDNEIETMIMCSEDDAYIILNIEYDFNSNYELINILKNLIFEKGRVFQALAHELVHYFEHIGKIDLSKYDKYVNDDSNLFYCVEEVSAITNEILYMLRVYNKALNSKNIQYINHLYDKEDLSSITTLLKQTGDING